MATAANIPSQALIGVARALVQCKLIDDKKAREIQAKAVSDKVSFLEALGSDNRANGRRASEMLAKLFDMPLFDLDAIDIDAMPTGEIADIKKIEEMRAIPLFVRGPRIFVAVSDPTLQQSLEFFAHKSGKKTEPVVIDDAQISAFIAKAKGGKADMAVALSDEELNFDLADGEDSAPIDDAALEADEGEDSPVVKFVKGILLTAIKKGASDIHFEPYEKYYRVRIRVDGALKEMARPPSSYSQYISSRIKVISNLNIAEKRVPQDGRMKIKIPGGRYIDFRVSTCPVMYGEKIVMRILDPSSAQLGIDALGYEPEEKKNLLDAISRSYGMVLVTGPTGSGKTVSLYTCLNILNKEDINISTAEDPAEIQLPGINQVNVNVAQGLTFSAALKSFLRQDPDIIMVGEIRDEETAEISVKAAQTGHLVLATLHTNDAPKTIGRLMEIGVKPYNIAASVNLITAQRLARRLCPQCKQPDSEWTFAKLVEMGMSHDEAGGYNDKWKAYKPSAEGCERCNSGYKGRCGIYQVMPISEGIREIILRGGGANEIAAQSRKDGIRDLRQSALLKFRQGVTSMSEVTGCTNLEQ